MAPDTPTIETAFNEHAAALRALGSALEAAHSARYEASVGVAPASSSQGGPANPTMDIALDARRGDLSAAVTRTAIALWHMTERTRELEQELNSYLAAWHGEPSAKTGK